MVGSRLSWTFLTTYILIPRLESAGRKMVTKRLFSTAGAGLAGDSWALTWICAARLRFPMPGKSDAPNRMVWGVHIRRRRKGYGCAASVTASVCSFPSRRMVRLTCCPGLAVCM